MKDMKEKTMGKFAYSISLVFKVVLCLVVQCIYNWQVVMTLHCSMWHWQDSSFCLWQFMLKAKR